MSGKGNRGQMPAPPVKASEMPDVAPALVAQNDHDAAAATMMDKTEVEQDTLASELASDFEEVAAKDLKIQTEPKNDSVHTVRANKKGIEVRATRAGFIQQSRKIEGDVFTIASMDEFGDWMELTDAKAEAKRKVEAKAAKLKAAAVKAKEDEELAD